MSDIELTDSERRRLLATVIACISVVALSLGMTVPLVSIVLEQKGTESTLIGLIAAMPAVGILIFSPLIPRLVVGIGPKATLFFGIGVAGGSILILPWFDSIGVWLALRFIMGCADALLFTVSETWINQLARDHNRGRLVAIYATVLSIGLASGPALFMLTGTEGAYPFLVAGAILFVAALPVVGMGKRLPTMHGASSFSVLGFLRVAPTLCAAVLLFAFIDGAGLSMLPVFGIRHGFDTETAALMVTALIAGNIGLQLPIGWLADHTNRTLLHFVLGCTVLLSSAALPFAAEYAAGMLWPLLFVLGAAAGGVYTLTLIIAGQRFRGADLVAANAAIGVLWGIGNLAGPMAAGFSMRSLGADGLPLALALAASMFLAVFVYRHFGAPEGPAPVARMTDGEERER